MDVQYYTAMQRVIKAFTEVPYRAYTVVLKQPQIVSMKIVF